MDDIRTAAKIGVDFVAVSFPKSAADMYRITSYNVCYTKLLRYLIAISTGFVLAGPVGEFAVVGRAGGNVITSYSIHYTKLYDPLIYTCSLHF